MKAWYKLFHTETQKYIKHKEEGLKKEKVENTSHVWKSSLGLDLSEKKVPLMPKKSPRSECVYTLAS